MAGWFSKDVKSAQIQRRIDEGKAQLAKLQADLSSAEDALGAALASGGPSDKLLDQIATLKAKIEALANAIARMNTEYTASLAAEQRAKLLADLGAAEKEADSLFSRLNDLKADAVKRID